jgi:hypothetical protein
VFTIKSRKLDYFHFPLKFIHPSPLLRFPDRRWT